MNIFIRCFISLGVMFFYITVANAQTIAVPDGYAEGTTGGGSATPTTVSSASAFKSAVGSNTSAVIVVDGRLNVGEVSIGSNKTVIGKDTASGLYGGSVRVRGSNCIFQNLTVGPSPTDAMEVSGATKVFVHKCAFYDGADGSLDIVRASDNVTVSWCKFYYVDQTTHLNTILIGNGDNVSTDAGKLHVTMHHNWFAEKCDQRMPRVRYGHVHIYNNYYNSKGCLYCIGTGVHCRIRVENSHFDEVNNPWKDYSGVSTDGQIGWEGLKFTNGASQPSYAPNSFPVFTPPYSYAMDPVDDVKALVQAGAGNVFGNTTGTAPRSDAASPSHGFAVYPNPVSGNLDVVLNGSSFEGMRITLYSGLGRLIMREKVDGSKCMVHNGSLSNGCYIFCLEGRRGNTIEKIVKKDGY
ncbi:MAG: T9SS type A sorting domain-containing protein [Chitinispirillaceae bacterium]|nr:T9SS type A sorting domain-containing protein [Chitinispirillaceae bacterium]